MTQTRLYLDIDGCINSINAGYYWGETRTAEVREPSDSEPRRLLTISWAPTLIAALDRLIADFAIEVVWLTTWNENDAITRELVPALGGLSGGRVLPYTPSAMAFPDRARWKATALLGDQAAGPTPLIWIDDTDVESYGWKILQQVDRPSLLIPTNVLTGITPEEVSRMRDWLDAQNPSASLTARRPRSRTALPPGLRKTPGRLRPL